MALNYARPFPTIRTIDRRKFGLGLLATCLTTRATAESSSSIVAWGDSLTFGSGASTPAARYPAVLEGLFTPRRTVRNAGVGGESSSQIAARMLGETRSHNETTIIWAGRNNYGNIPEVLADVKAMVEAVKSKRVLVLSVLNADTSEERRGDYGYRIIVELNDALRADHGERYIDIRTRLIDIGLTMSGITPSALDRADVARDVPPRALRDDHIHLNDAGQAVVARIVHASLIARGW
jgi:lysophospholipase L1-like esterase